MCKNGNPACRDMSDTTHECPSLFASARDEPDAEPTPRCVACGGPRDVDSSLCERCEDERDREREGDHYAGRDYGDARL